MKNTDIEIASITKELIESNNPNEWIRFLFDIQNTLISLNHLGAYTPKGSMEFANKFAELKGFFQDLSKLKTNETMIE